MFKALLSLPAFGWKGPHLVCQRLNEAVTEVKNVARADRVSAGDSVVSLMERKHSMAACLAGFRMRFVAEAGYAIRAVQNQRGSGRSGPGVHAA